ncbi:TlpA family protein disulfide reductase [Wenzhouxiangella marina]|uniref:Thioredoxin n=1 Tax=Wenzhouxiangella marina TaxID=1579979 RepID=A0A0K0XSZ6_9GAMM|nr:TlpA disulfide reductase family protein [Wenzhouxiangella marina]AKS40741.1 Thioredoxin [Wenzhouxiangella marina]MBB6087614.1 thiol-disulfide isomerase/thioredoxin [Wenzhouxiangella marina]
MSRLGLYIAVAVGGLALGAGLAWFTRPAPPPVGVEGASVGDPRPPFQHAALDGRQVHVDDFDDQLLLVNFWATWCAPCRREMPLLDQAQRTHGDQLTVLGIAIDDPGAVIEFLDSTPVSYPILVGSTDVVATQRAWGNAAGALPYTVLVDREGIIRWQHLGEVSEEELAEKLAAHGLSTPL